MVGTWRGVAVDDDDLEQELTTQFEGAKTSYPEADRRATTVAALHALAVLRAAKSQDASSRHIETATARLATFTMWLMILTGVLAAATIALVIATVAST
jgi:hypothetical protein